MIPKPELPLHIDSTMLTCFRSCPRKFYNEFVLGLRAGKSIDLHAGAVFSSTLEHFYKTYWTTLNGPYDPARLITAVNSSQRHFMQQWGDFESNKPNSPKTKENIWTAIEEYIVHYPPRSDHIQPFFVNDRPTFEFSFAIPLEPAVIPLGRLPNSGPEFPLHPSGQPFVFCGRPDLLGHWNGKTIIRDEKTAGRLESKWSEHWDLRSQFMGYIWAAQQMGLKCDTVSVRGVIITKTQPTRFPEAFKIYHAYDITRWVEQLRRDLWRIRRCWDEKYWDWNFGETCTQYGLCPYMGMCKSFNESNWYSQFEISRWNPLNRNPVSDTSSELASPTLEKSSNSTSVSPTIV